MVEAYNYVETEIFAELKLERLNMLQQSLVLINGVLAVMRTDCISEELD